MKHKILLSLFSAAMLTAGGAYAGGGNLLGGEGGGNMTEGSMYGGASYGQATTNCAMADAFGKEEDCKTPGWKIYGGYRITDMFSVEGGYYNLGSATESHTGTAPLTSSLAIANPTIESSATGIAASAVASLPVMDNLEVFGKAGAIKWTSEGTMTGQLSGAMSGPASNTQTISGTSLLLGAGASYQVNENWGVRGEYERFTREDINKQEHNVDVLSAGVTYSTM